MKIGDHGVHAAKAIARVDKDIGVALQGLRALSSMLAGGFQRAHRRGAHRHHPASPGTGLAHGFANRLVHLDIFGMHHMVCYGVGPHRLESAGPDMQRHHGPPHAFGIQLPQQLLGEMQPRGGCGHRALAPGIHRLVALLVSPLIGPLDIGRQRHVANRLHDIGQRRPAAAAELEQGALPTGDREAETGGRAALQRTQSDDGARPGGFAGTNMGQGSVTAGHSLHQDFDFAPGIFPAPEASRYNPGVIEHQQVIGTDEVGELAEAMMAELPAGAVQAQQSTGAALGQRILGDQFRGEYIVEVGTLHAQG